MLVQTPRGTKDLLPDYCEVFRYIQNSAFDIARLYGFKWIDTPIFEHTELFTKTLGDSSDVVSKEMYNFQDKSGNSLTLRPEYTAAVVRMFANAGLWNELPLRFFATGPLFRYDRPQKGRYRQFHQINCEILGLSKAYADAEIIALSADFLKKIGLLHKVRLEINSLGDRKTIEDYRQALCTYLRGYINDLSSDSKIRLDKNPLRILDSKDPQDKKILLEAPKISEFYTKEAQDFFDNTTLLLKNLEIPYKVNPYLVRGLDYYLHTVFEFVSDDLGAQSAVLGGGRYDCSFICNKTLDAVGFAAGIERIIELISYQSKKSSFIYLVPIGDRAQDHAPLLAHNLRNMGFLVLLDYSGSLNKKMQKANKYGAKLALIFGDDELDNNIYTLRLMQTGFQEIVKDKNLMAKLKQIL